MQIYLNQIVREMTISAKVLSVEKPEIDIDSNTFVITATFKCLEKKEIRYLFSKRYFFTLNQWKTFKLFISSKCLKKTKKKLVQFFSWAFLVYEQEKEITFHHS